MRLQALGTFLVAACDGDGLKDNSAPSAALGGAEARAYADTNHRVGWQGLWLEGVDYQAGDAVAYLGSAYIATQDNFTYATPTDPIFWDVLALKGERGGDGVAGAAGADGARGLQGETGTVGPKGDTGLAGVPGAKGEAGARGTQGRAGQQGSTGNSADIGPQGASGAQGPKGDTQGAVGPHGATGATGRHGSAGSRGLNGETGSLGPAGAQGDTDEQGLKGNVGKPGRQGITRRGPWSASETYLIDEAVSFSGRSYIAVLDTSAGVTPVSAVYCGALVAPGLAAGRYGMNAACEADYGSGARIARREEMLLGRGIAAGSGSAWYEVYSSEYSTPSSASCGAWSSNDSNGTTIDLATGSLAYEPCSTAQAVACSAPE